MTAGLQAEVGGSECLRGERWAQPSQVAEIVLRDLDGCCLFDTCRQLKRQFIQYIDYFGVYMIFNRSFTQEAIMIYC
jgi:hypothetical protein